MNKWGNFTEEEIQLLYDAVSRSLANAMVNVDKEEIEKYETLKRELNHEIYCRIKENKMRKNINEIISS